MALMAEPVPAADETVALNGGETVAAPQSAAPDAGDLAWSGDDGDGIQNEPTAERQSWRATWRKAGALLMGGLALAGAIVLAFWVLSPGIKAVQPSPTASPPPASTAPATAAAPTAVPPSIVSTPDQDNKYVKALNDRGISFANPDAAIYNGKMVCDNITRGMTVPQIVAAFRTSNPALAGDADAYVAISVHAYCPQNNGLVSGSS